MKKTIFVLGAGNGCGNRVAEKFGTPDVLFYNVGITGLDSEIKEEKDVDLLMERYKVDVAGAYHAIQQVLGEDFSPKNGVILVTGGGLSLYPMYDYLPLSMDKAALRAKDFWKLYTERKDCEVVH